MEKSEWIIIYSNLNLLTTEEIEENWLKHNENEWTPIAFNVMEKILLERMGELPKKEDSPSDSSVMKNLQEKESIVEELQILARDNDPVFYDPNKVTLLVKWIFRSMNILIILYVLQFLTDFKYFQDLFSGGASWIDILISIGTSILALLLSIIITFIEYKAMGYVLKILREMEINSRKNG
jgi:hypothetical protein